MSMDRPCRFALVAVAAWFAGCAPGDPPHTTTPENAATPAVTAAPAAQPVPDTATTLLAYEWRLASADDAAGQSIAAFFPSADQPLGIQFVDDRLGVTGGCNRLSVGYQLLDGTQLRLGQGMSTMMACPPPLATADAAFGKFLSGDLKVAIEGAAGAPQLRLSAVDGTTLLFNGTPTPETRFGGPATRAFLEVSPDPCTVPAALPRPCLLVRDLHFDEQGLASGEPGEWRSLPEGVEGYTPVDGKQQVLRVKRFERAGGATADTPTVHYILDLVVRTSTVR